MLVLALLLVVFVGVMGAGVLQLSSGVTRRQAGATDLKQAFYLAEAGLAESFFSLHTGKGGAVGSKANPAVFGDGLFWVEITKLDDTLYRLDSFGMSGSGRTHLSKVVRRKPLDPKSLGIFSDSGIGIGKGILIDGFSSKRGSYASQLVGTGTSAHADTGARIGSNGAIQINGLLDSIPIVGGLLGSLLGTPTSIYGSARPGPSATLSLLGSPLITGSTAPVASQVPLPPVEVPALTSQGALSYAAGDVHVLPPGKAAFNGLTLSNGSKLVVQGPAVLVLGSLSMLSRGELSFDTTGGPVAIYVTGNVDMASGTLLGMTANDPSLVSFYMSGDGATANLAGTSQFYGSVYAPDAAVTVGNAFELHGSLAGGSVTLQDGAKVHVDRGLGSEWHDGSIPESVSWRIVELEVQRTRAGSSDPFVELGLDPALLAGPAGAHKLDDVLLDVQFENLLGVTVSYSGVESSFDWNLVRSVVDVTRKIL